MKNDEFDRVAKKLENDMLFFVIIECVGSVLLFVLWKNFDVIFYRLVFLNIMYVFVFVFCYFSAKKKKTYVGKIGIVVSILLIMSILVNSSIYALINVILGIFMLLHSMKYNSFIENDRNGLKYVCGVIVIFVLYVIIVNNFINLYGYRVTCVRKNGDKLVIVYNNRGINKYLINGKESNDGGMKKVYEYVFNSYGSRNNYLNDFKKQVMESEKISGATCK